MYLLTYSLTRRNQKFMLFNHAATVHLRFVRLCMFGEDGTSYCEALGA
jgi:hypothetical protein